MLSKHRSSSLIALTALGLTALACSLLTPGGRANSTEPPSAIATLPSINISPRDAPTSSESAINTLDALRNTAIPIRDRVDLAQRFYGLSPDDITPPEIQTYQVGASELFWARDSDSDEVFQLSAVLRYVTPHVYMWVDVDDEYEQNALAQAAERFEEQTYPTTRRYFGEEASPGIDGDVRLHILHTSKIGATVAGYYYSQSQYPEAVAPYSNEREMFFINIGNTQPGDGHYDGVLAHEFQHMIHWNVDRNEDSWVNEGLSELSVLLNQLDTTGSELLFFRDTDLQLNNWPEADGRAANYGASYLFHAYFLERFGQEMLQQLVRNPSNGLQGVQDTLAQQGVADPVSGQPITAVDFFADWTVANLVNDPALGDGRYHYSLVTFLENTALTEEFSRLPVQESSTVSQFGADYIQLPPAREMRITFTGLDSVRVLPTDTVNSDSDPATADRFAWWSNRGDDSNTRLTTRLDLTGIDSATLEYDVWYLIEENWDYAYVEVSQDEGATWEILPAAHTTDENPHGTSYGFGYTGSSADQPTANSNGWLHETVDLSDYAGGELLLRFEMVTDDAVNQPGMLIDNIRVDAIGFYDNVENGGDLWQAEGFVRHDNLLPQEYVVQVLSLGRSPQITRLQLDADNHGELLFQPGADASKVTLVISGVTPFTNEPAAYTYSVSAQ